MPGICGKKGIDQGAHSIEWISLSDFETSALVSEGQLPVTFAALNRLVESSGVTRSQAFHLDKAVLVGCAVRPRVAPAKSHGVSR